MSAGEPIAVETNGRAAAVSRSYDLEAISTLTDEEIHKLMPVADLIGIIRSVDYPFAGKERLEYFDRDTLERVVCLVRRWSCNRLGKLSL